MQQKRTGQTTKHPAAALPLEVGELRGWFAAPGVVLHHVLLPHLLHPFRSLRHALCPLFPFQLPVPNFHLALLRDMRLALAVLAVVTAATVLVAGWTAITGSMLAPFLTGLFGRRLFWISIVMLLLAWGWKIMDHRGIL